MYNPENNYLVTSDSYFFGPDGNQYRAAWGKPKMISTKEAFDFNPSRSTNWFLQLGEGEGAVFIAGCQIHFAVQCENPPVIREGTYVSKDSGLPLPINDIYIATAPQRSS